jgi:translation initiation factor 1
MSDINPNSGIEDELDISDSLARAEQKITVRIDSRSYNKEMTVVEGLGEDIDLDELSSALKSKLACGGTAKDGNIELQGDHTRRIKDVLAEEGFDKENVEVK